MGVRIGVMTSRLSDGIDSKRQKCTTLPATQVCLRPVKAGLGGHEAGVSGVDEGVEKTSLPILKGGRMALFVCTTFSDFLGVGNDVFVEKRNNKKAFTYNYVFFPASNMVSILPAVKDECWGETLVDSGVWFDDVTR